MRLAATVMGMILAGCASAYPPDYAGVKDTTLRLEVSGGVCSGTVIGHHLVLTAEHCIEGGIKGWVINGRSAKITKVVSDKHDHVLLTTDLYFEHAATFGPAPRQGDVTFSYGNPEGIGDILLVGSVAGWADVGPVKHAIVLNRSDWYGCSGAAVFDEQGRIIGVVNAMFPADARWHLTALFPLAFKESDYA